MTGVPLLTLAIALPLVGAAAAAVRAEPRRLEGRRWSATWRWRSRWSTFAVTLALWAGFDPSAAAPAFQFVERHAWIPAFGIDYYVGIDGISLMLLVLTGFLTPIALLSSWESVEKKVKEFSIFMLLLEAAMIGVFVLARPVPVLRVLGLRCSSRCTS